METIKDGIIGLTIGDAIGVPVEFLSREELVQNPFGHARIWHSSSTPNLV